MQGLPTSGAATDELQFLREGSDESASAVLAGTMMPFTTSLEAGDGRSRRPLGTCGSAKRWEK